MLAVGCCWPVVCAQGDEGAGENKEGEAKEGDDANGDDDGKDKDKDDDDGEGGLSKAKKKKLTRMSVSQLKQLVKRPDVVEVHDVTAADPVLLVHLKAYRNTVPVPRHWCLKRKYLQVCCGYCGGGYRCSGRHCCWCCCC